MGRLGSIPCTILVHVNTEEVFMVMWLVGDASGSGTWSRIYQQYSPSAPATVIQDLMRVMSLGRVKRQQNFSMI